jgi:hypothetical protein
MATTYKRKQINLLIHDIKNVKPDRIDVCFGPETDDPWMTIFDGELPRRPIVGDVLRIQQPRPIAIIEPPNERAK